MLHRFYDIVAESDDLQEYKIEKEYTLDIPDRDLSTAIDRQENIATMFDMIVAASGHNVCSFSTETIS